MPIITDDKMREISLPFPSFQPNTIILSEQINDNNDELQYRTNSLIVSYNDRLTELVNFEKFVNTHISTYNNFVTATGANFTSMNALISTNKTQINNRVDTEVSVLNKKISDNKTSCDAQIANLSNTKANLLELKNKVLLLKNDAKILSAVDLAPILGTGTVGYGAKGVSYSFDTVVTDWTPEVDENDNVIRYFADVNHRLNTEYVITSCVNNYTNDSFVINNTIIDSNTVRVYNDRPIQSKIVVINASSSIEMINAMLDDLDTNTYRTWSSSKIKTELDKKSGLVVTSDPNIPRTQNGLYFVVTSTQNGGSGTSPGNTVTTKSGYGLKIL